MKEGRYRIEFPADGNVVAEFDLILRGLDTKVIIRRAGHYT